MLLSLQVTVGRSGVGPEVAIAREAAGLGSNVAAGMLLLTTKRGGADKDLSERAGLP